MGSSSAVTALTATLPPDDRLSGVLSRTAALEEGARGLGRGALDSCHLSSQSSLFIFLLRIAWSSLQSSGEDRQAPNPHPEAPLLYRFSFFSGHEFTGASHIRGFLKIYAVESLFFL